MLATLPVILLPLAVLGVREEVELASNQTVDRHWEKKTYEFCLGSPQEIECGGGEDQSMTIKSAMYNRNTKDKKGKSCMEYSSESESCEPDAKTVVMYQCEGTQKCKLMPEDYSQCFEKPFLKMRLVVWCSVGEPRPEPVRQACDQENPCPKIKPVPKPVVKPEDAYTAKLEDLAVDLSEGLGKQLPQAMENYLSWHVRDKPVMKAETYSPTTEQPVHIVNIMAQEAARQKVVKEVESDGLVALSFVPCFRWSRYEKLSNFEVFGDWYHYEFLARLTNCDHYEGCFQLALDDQRVFQGFNNRPEPHDLIEGKLVEDHDDFWVTWQGTGLKRNDYDTWGVCLPKTGTLQHAITLWDHLRSGGAPDDLAIE